MNIITQYCKMYSYQYLAGVWMNFRKKVVVAVFAVIK